MSKPNNPGKPAAPGKRSPLADRRLLLPVGFVLLVGAWYGFQWWRENAGKAEMRSQLIADTQTELAKEKPNKDVLGDLMARLTRLPDAATAPELLAAQAEIELLRGRPERADRMFGAIASSPSASAMDQQLGARILIRKQDGFGGEAAESQAMLQQVVTFSENAYAESGEAEDLFRAWQASKRLWDHERAKNFAAQLASGHADSKEHKLVALSGAFNPQRDGVAVDDLAIDFGDQVPAELAAMQTTVLAQAGKVPEALARAEKDLNRFAGVGGVRFVLALVLHACALSSKEGSLDRATFVQRRDEQLDWLETRAPAGEAQRAQWQQIRAVK